MTQPAPQKYSQKLDIARAGEIPKTTAVATAGIQQNRNPADLSLHFRFVEYGRNAKEWLRKCALLLPEIDRQQIWEKKGFSSIFEYAGKLAGMSKSSVELALRILDRVEKMPALRRVIEEKGIQSVRPVAAIVTPETAEFWAEKAKIMSKHTLETYVREYKKQYRLNGRPGAEFQPENLNPDQAFPGASTQPEKTITMSLAPDIAAELEKLKGKGDWNTLMKELLQLRKEKLEAEKPKPVETPSRHIPAKVKKFAIEKTRGQCAYPGCHKPYKTLHHTQRFALDPVHDPDHLVPLCEAHEHLAHHGLIANEDRSPDQWGVLLEPEWWDFKQVVDKRVAEYRGK